MHPDRSLESSLEGFGGPRPTGSRVPFLNGFLGIMNGEQNKTS